MCQDANGHCTVFNEIKIANVFGQYTSLLTGISVTFPCDPDNFEEEAKGYHSRITRTIQSFQNRTLEAVGKEKVWHGKGGAVPAGETKSVKKAVKKKSGSKAVARKRVPRKS